LATPDSVLGREPARHHQRHSRHLEDRERQPRARIDSVRPSGPRRHHRPPAGRPRHAAAGGAAVRRARGRPPHRPRRSRPPAPDHHQPARNALKFTERGEVVVTVRLTAIQGGLATVQFSVRDTGIGIPADKLDVIFEQFRQADASTTRRYGGTGLGLGVVRRLVTIMGGELHVESALGRGSDFSFLLHFPLEAALSHTRPPPAELRGARVLGVDDNATNRRIVREMLAGAGATVDEAPTADAGLGALHRAQLAGAPYNLAIIDGQMPDRDGFELAETVRSDRRHGGTRLLMLTSMGQKGDAQRCRDLGIQAYLTKPISRAELVMGIAAVLGATLPPDGRGPVITRHTIEEARRHLRVLLAEDNPVNQEVAATMLRKRGHTVDIVGDGQAAVEAVTRNDYDLVLMDVQMPVLDGFAATAAIRALAKGRGLPIYALTADALAGA